MKTVTVKRDEFVERVTANKEKHRGNFELAQAGYREFLISELDRRLDEAKRGLKIDHYIRLVEPEDHTDDYETVLEMATMSVDDTIELSQQEFAWYVLDKWQWKQAWVDNANTYTAGAIRD